LTAPSGWRVEFTARAARDLKRLDPPVRQRVYDALERLTSAEPAGDVTRLKGRDEWRLRVGDWRALFQRAPDIRTLFVLRVLPRGRAYRD